jgi:hypothetical protein
VATHFKQDFSYVQQVWEENPRTEGDHQAHFKAMSGRASSQWKVMSDTEKAVCAILVKVVDERLTGDLADRNITSQRKPTLLPGKKGVRQSQAKLLESFPSDEKEILTPIAALSILQNPISASYFILRLQWCSFTNSFLLQ